MRNAPAFGIGLPLYICIGSIVDYAVDCLTNPLAEIALIFSPRSSIVAAFQSAISLPSSGHSVYRVYRANLS